MNNIQWYIFDLDGTLYDFWGTTFGTSRLWVKVKERYFMLIQEWDLWDPSGLYNGMIEVERKEKIGISQQLANVTWKTRWEILALIWWPIDTGSVIENDHYSKQIIPALSEMDKQIFLVTAAPKIWASKALEFMALSQYFQQVLTLEDFGSLKKEAFSRIQKESWIEVDQFISVGDQMHSDIVPAEELWMQSLYVTSQKDLLNLI